MPSALCRGGKAARNPTPPPGGQTRPGGGAERSRAAQLGDRFRARSPGSPRSPFERDTPRVGAASQPTPEPPEAAGAGAAAESPVLGRAGRRWRRAGAPTFAPHAPGGPAGGAPSPTPEAAATPFLAGTVRPRSGPARKSRPGRRLAARKGAWPRRAGLGVRLSESTQRPPSLRGAPVEAPSRRQQPRPRPPPPPLGGTQRLRPAAPAHPGSGSAAGPGPPARGTFSSRPTTGVGRSHPETWLRRRVGGEPTARGGAGRGDVRSAPEPHRHHPRAGPRGRPQRLRKRRRLRPRSPGAPRPELGSYSPRTGPNVQIGNSPALGLPQGAGEEAEAAAAPPSPRSRPRPAGFLARWRPSGGRKPLGPVPRGKAAFILEKQVQAPAAQSSILQG